MISKERSQNVGTFSETFCLAFPMKKRKLKKVKNEKQFNSAFETIRLRAGVSPERLADVGGVSTTSIDHYRAGTRVPKLNTAWKIRAFISDSLGKEIDFRELWPELP